MLKCHYVALGIAILLALTSDSLARSHRHHRPHIAATQSQQKQDAPTNGPGTGNSDQRGTESAPIVVKLLNTGQSAEEAAENARRVSEAAAEQKRSTNWTIGLTFALILATILQFFALLYQAHWLRRTVKVSERALTELEGPFIVVKIIAARIDFHNLRDIVFGDLIFSFANYGRTPAHILDFTESITPVKRGASLPLAIDPIKERGAPMPYGVIAPPNSETQRFKTPAQFDFFLENGEEGDSQWEITQRPYFRGYVRYADIFENVNVLGFCFAFDTQGSRWVLMGNQNHNYCRKEKSRPEAPSWYQPSADPHSVRASLYRAMTSVLGRQ